jgi:hypothetical protein
LALEQVDFQNMEYMHNDHHLVQWLDQLGTNGFGQQGMSNILVYHNLLAM